MRNDSSDVPRVWALDDKSRVGDSRVRATDPVLMKALGQRLLKRGWSASWYHGLKLQAKRKKSKSFKREHRHA